MATKTTYIFKLTGDDGVTFADLYEIDAETTDDLLSAIYAVCDAECATGAHVAYGRDGFHPDGTGYERGYCGWVDARRADYKHPLPAGLMPEWRA